ncbi:hypothetical protein [Salinisphaera shabanensis]|uniref:hypothetical protein n=1 Tax=Salinisphaera shabanensis TaxID=180542 RepID=UPI00333FF4A9
MKNTWPRTAGRWCGLCALVLLLGLTGCNNSSDDDSVTDSPSADRTTPDPVSTEVAADPSEPGAFEVVENEYNFGRMNVMDWKNGDSYGSDIHGYIQYPRDAAGPFPVLLFLHGRHGTCYDDWGHR